MLDIKNFIKKNRPVPRLHTAIPNPGKMQWWEIDFKKGDKYRFTDMYGIILKIEL